MYENYWGLKEKPFENTPDPHFLYHSSKHEEALSRLLYTIRERKGAGMLSGEYGSGKTLLSRALLDELDKEHYRVVLIFNPNLQIIEFLKEIIHQLGGNSSFNTKTELLHVLNEILYSNQQSNKNTVILIDEAQAIKSDEIFEELRLLLNFQLNDMFLLTLVLLGQPELKEKIDKIPQLKQRMGIRYHLFGLNEQETQEYIIHRLKIAGISEGVSKGVFPKEGCHLIFKGSAGIPRRINNICDMCLLIGFSEKKSNIDKGTVEKVIADLEEDSITVSTETSKGKK